MTDDRVEKGITCSVKSCTNSTGQMALPPVDQPQAPDTVEKLLQAYKVESCQQQRRFSSCKHLSLVSLLNSSVFLQVRVLTPTWVTFNGLAEQFQSSWFVWPRFEKWKVSCDLYTLEWRLTARLNISNLPGLCDPVLKVKGKLWSLYPWVTYKGSNEHFQPSWFVWPRFESER